MIARTFPALLAAAAIASVAPHPAAAQAARTGASAKADLLDRAVVAWARVKTARATFEQQVVNSLTGTTMKSSGEYQQQRPGKLSVRFNDPATDRIVADGRDVWLYLPSTAPGQVIRSPLQAGGTGTVDLSAQFLTSPRTRYVVTAQGAGTVNGRPTHSYSLVPRTRAGAPFTKALVQIDDADATIRQFTVTENSGLERTVRLTSFRTNVPVDPSAFTFTPPTGTRVVVR